MNSAAHDFTGFGFTRTFFLPALLIFLVPIVTLVFFYHAQATLDRIVLNDVRSQLLADKKLNAAERQVALEQISHIRFSELALDNQFAGTLDPQLRTNYAIFRWMIRLSQASIIGGVLVFLLAGVCVWGSLRSQFAQYIGLLMGWHILRAYGALQSLVIAILLVALSYWIPVLWFHAFLPQLTIAIGVISLAGVIAVVTGFLRSPKMESIVEGEIIPFDIQVPICQDLQSICTKVGTGPPNQIVVGIEDNFYVTETRLIAEGRNLSGKTLYVSLPLLKQLNATEADSVLAHEMAHFSGQDTFYSERISPLLMRYDTYLSNLFNGVVTLPAFYFMLCFRELFELSLSVKQRQREFRADRVAADVTSPRDVASSLLRGIAFTRFRMMIQVRLFEQNHLFEAADVSRQLEQGFAAYALQFAAQPEIGQLETAHPYDTHPTLMQRVSKLGIQLDSDFAFGVLSAQGDGGWYHKIPHAADIERRQWQSFEDQFRNAHMESLAYRFRPDSPEEQALVETTFPVQTFASRNDVITLDYEKIQHSQWSDPLYFNQLVRCELNRDSFNRVNGLNLYFNRNGSSVAARNRVIRLQKLAKNQQEEFLNAFQQYYGRYLAAIEYIKQNAEAKAEQKHSAEGV